MALKKSLTLTNNFGLENHFDGVVVRVQHLSGDKKSIAFEAKYLSGEKILQTKMFAFEPSMTGPNFVKQAYEHLKTLKEFDDAADC
jgi:cytochrome c oxidase assembly protein Cox11